MNIHTVKTRQQFRFNSELFCTILFRLNMLCLRFDHIAFVPIQETIETHRETHCLAVTHCPAPQAVFSPYKGDSGRRPRPML